MNWRTSSGTELPSKRDCSMTPNREEGYLDGLHGRTNRECSPNYSEGWEAGRRERMLTWGRAAQPAPDLTHDAEERN